MITPRTACPLLRTGAAVRSGAPKPRLVRQLAVPVNPATSIDPMLGTSAPPAPAAQADGQAEQRNADDTKMLNDMVKPNSSTARDLAAQRARIERLRNSAMGSSRRSSAVPGSKDMLASTLNTAQQQLREDTHAIPTPQTATEADPEVPHTIDDSVKGRIAIERYAVAAARELQQQRQSGRQVGSLAEHHKALYDKAHVQLSFELPYEPNPRTERQVPLTSALSTSEEVAQASDDGVLLLCFVDNVGSGHERVSVCSGFAIQGGEAMASEGGTHGELVVSCAHTLRSMLPERRRSSVYPEDAGKNGVVLAVSRLGHVYPVHSVVSCIPEADLTLLQLDEKPVAVGATGPPLDSQRLRTLPMSPYPAVVDTELSVSSFGGWQPEQSAEDDMPLTRSPTLTEDTVVKSRWGRARVVGYKDPIGRVAETGTYDELFQMDFKLKADAPENPEDIRPYKPFQSSNTFPLTGSSGGPVVDVKTGSVVGVVRGYRVSQVQGSRGDAIPGEKVFEFFALPGLGKRK